jgi:hypothetical protein
VIRFPDVTKGSISLITIVCFAKLAWTETDRGDLKLLLDLQREGVGLFLFDRRSSRTA